MHEFCTEMWVSGQVSLTKTGTFKMKTLGTHLSMKIFHDQNYLVENISLYMTFLSFFLFFWGGGDFFRGVGGWGYAYLQAAVTIYKQVPRFNVSM